MAGGVVGKVHTHHIQVETEEEAVSVVIGGGEGGPPGGFSKLFNRVIDTGVWATLSDSAKAAYLPLVRFADHRNQFRVRVGQAAIMKHAGLSRSSAKRAMKELLASKLVALVEQGGVTENGENESNLYQLMVPVAPKARRGGEPATNPLSVRQRTPSPTPQEPPVGPWADRPAGRSRTEAGARDLTGPGSACGPQLRSIPQENSKKPDAAALLAEKGVDAAVAAELARSFDHERIVDVVATMEYRRARGKCDNPGGFIRDALIRKWPTPKAVIDARARAEANLKRMEADRQSRAAVEQQVAQVEGQDRLVEQKIAALDDEELAILAESVLKKYEGNAAVLSVLTRKPPRACRLMKMEIAAMLGG